jgi:hypothetical protein
MHFLLTLAVAATSLATPVQVTRGSHVVGPNETAQGSVVVLNGNLDVYGTVRGNAAAIRGDVILHRGARVTQNAVAAFGQVRNEGAAVGGAIRMYDRNDFRRAAMRSHAAPFVYRPWHAFGVSIGWLLLVTIIGFAALSIAGDKVDVVVNTLRGGVGKSFASGLLGQLLIVPGAVAVIVLLAVSIVGILIIPLGLIAYIALLLGLGMLGFIAAALLTGSAITARNKKDETPRGAMLRAFLVGASVYIGIWIVAAVFSWMPLLGALLRSFAAGATFVAMTAGFGAVLLSYWRGDFRRIGATS